MKKNKLLNLLLRGSSVKSGAGGGGSGGRGSATATQNSSGAEELSEGPVAPNPVIQRHSTRRSRHSVRDADGAAGVERSSSWKYTHDHTPDSFSINSSPSILDGRSGRSDQESHTPVIEKSQSWSGDRVLDCTTDSGSSRGGTGTNNSSRAGSTACSRAGSRSGSRTGTGSRSSKERGSGGQINSHGGSERGDSTPSSVYEQVADDTSRNEQVTSFNAQSPKDDSAPYENVDIPSPQRDSGDSSSGQRSSSRLSVKSNRRSRRSSPRRPGGSPQPGMGQGLPHQDSRTSRSGSVRGGVPSISLVTSSPTPSRLTTRGYSRSPSRERTVVTAQVAPPRDTWVPQPVPQQYHPHTILPATMGRYGDQILGTAPRSISHEEQSMSQIHRGPHLMTKARSWQHHSHDGSSGTAQSERARQLAKSRSWQQQHSMVLGHSIEAGRARPQHITRQQAVVQTQMIGKSRSWQQSHEADPIPGPLPRTYTVNEAQRRARRSSVRLAPPSPSRGLSPSRAHSQSRNHSPSRTHSPSRPQSRTHSPARSHSPGSLGTGLTSDSECEDKKSSASSTGGGAGGSAALDGQGGGGVTSVGRPFPSASPQPQTVVTSQDYNMEQSQVTLLRAELKIVTKDRDIMKKELKKVTRERDEALTRLASSTSGVTEPNNYGTMSKVEKNLPRDYEGLKMQCEKAMAEVQALHKQNIEITRKYENAMKDVEYYRKQERAAYGALQSLRVQYEEVVAEKQKLEHEVTSLQTIMEDDRKEIADLRRQQQEAMTQEGSGEAINQLYLTAVRNYEAIKDEYDAMRKRYSDLVASHSNNISKLELTQEEVNRLKKQYEEVMGECSSAVREKNCLKQQCTEAIRQWDSALREKNKIQEELLKTREKYDEMMKEMNTHLIQRQHLNKDLKRLQEERNAAMQEYTLVMSERDTVHKEMDKLQDELGQANKRIKNIEQNSKDAGKERGSLLLQIETLQREIAAALNDRDKALKECNDIKERFGAKEDTNKEWERSCHDYDNYKQEREMTLKEGSDVGSSAHDMYSKAQKERLDNLDQANQEIDRLRKQIEKLQNELQEAQQEAEVSKRRRDWAFSERDKIVLERESIRAHCDKLRRERDRAVSELAEALRDSDDMKKQRNEASKELKELRERVEAEQEKAAVVRQLTAHNHSRDSAIDTDLHEWETETLHLHIGVVSEREIGFELGGGRDDPHYGGNDGAVYITSLVKEGPFDGKLRLHDQIVRVNGIECRGLDRGSVIQAVVNGGGIVHMTVRRRRVGGRSLHTAHLHCLHLHHGITLQTGIYIANILHGSPAAREGSLAVGDRVININGKPAENISNSDEAQQMLDSSGDIVQLTVLKSHGSSSSSAPLSSSSSGHNITEDDKSTASSRPYSNPASPAKDISCVSNSGRVGRKLVPGSGGTLQGEEGGGGGRKYGSNERVYNVTKASGEKGSGSGPWDHFKSIVKPRKHSKERSESRDKEEKKKHMSPSLEQDKDLVLAQLDSVIDSYHSKTSSSSGGGTSTTKRSKKRDKEKSGGTWPKYRGGGSNTWDGVTSTVIHTQRRRERQPLSVLPTCSMSSQYACEEKSYDLYHREKRSSPRSTSSPHNPSSARSSGFPLYKSPESKVNTYSNPGPTYQQSSSLIYSTQPSVLFSNQSSYTASSPRNVSVERKSEESEHDRDRLSSLTPSDTSLDFSVRSGNMGKEELEYYVKKNRGKYPQSDSESNMSPVETCAPQSLSLPPVYGSRPSPLHHGGERTPSHSRISHPHAGPYSPPSTTMRSPTAFAPYSPVSHLPLTHSHSHPHTSIGSSIPNPLPRYSSPPTILSGGSHFLPPARSGDSILSSPSDRDSRDRYDRFASSPTPLGVSGVFYHSATPSLEIGGMPHKPRTVHLHPYRTDEPQLPLSHTSGPPSYHDYQLSIGTLSRKVKEEEQLRVASNASVGSKSSSSKGGSMERSSELGSPMPPSYSVEMAGGSTGRQQHITHISHSVHSPDYPQYWQRKPHPGDIRNIFIEKSLEPLGIQIRCLDNGGVFVSSVSVKSLASKVGLRVGDQLLEVCGINMRSATKQLATTVLSQCGNSITILVQYNPDKYREAEGSEGSSSDPGAASRSGSPTPCNSPKPAREPPMQVDEMPPSSTSTLRGPLDSTEHQRDHSPLDHSLPPSARSTLTRPEVSRVINTLSRQDTFLRRSENGGSSNGSAGNGSSSDTRLVYLELNKCHNLGIQMVGGNAVGIYVHAVMQDSPAAKAGLRPGDRILEYNGVDLRSATAEQAAFELAKPADKVTMLVQCDYQRYEEVQDQPGDSFYIRALFDRWGEVGDSTDLRFRKEDILYVDNTMFNNVPGQWRAWVVDEDGHKRQCGTIPSKDKVEEEIVLQRSLGDLHMDSSRRGSTSARRSFFRRKKHSRSSSRDSKELASFSDASLNSYTETAPMHDEPIPSSYIRVERLDYLVRRPVVLVGPLWELVCDKLVHDFPHKFTRCHPEIRRSSTQAMDAAVQENIIVDYRRRGSHFEATTVQQVKEICDKSCHGILDLSLSSVERLHRHNIYPIVLLLKFRHHKQIREVFDSHPTAEKISQKEAKEMYELSTKIEQEYKHLISAEITAGVNLAYICTHVKSCVDQEQSKTLWVPSGTI